MKTKINFEHKDYLTTDGKKLPSVTTILKVMNKPELVEWANMMGYKRQSVRKILDESAIIGTLVHYMIEQKCKKKPVPLYLNKLAPEPDVVLHCFKLFKNWYKDYGKPKFLYNELRLQNNEIGGCIDSICKIGDDYILLDFKTSKKIYPSMFLQIAGYYILLKDVRPDIANKLTKVAVLTLPKKNKKYNYILMDIEHLINYYVPAFNSLKDFYFLWRDNMKYDWNTELKL